MSNAIQFYFKENLESNFDCEISDTKYEKFQAFVAKRLCYEDPFAEWLQSTWEDFKEEQDNEEVIICCYRRKGEEPCTNKVDRESGYEYCSECLPYEMGMIDDDDY